jgi:hypothetical protein
MGMGHCSPRALKTERGAPKNLSTHPPSRSISFRCATNLAQIRPVAPGYRTRTAHKHRVRYIVCKDVLSLYLF